MSEVFLQQGNNFPIAQMEIAREHICHGIFISLEPLRVVRDRVGIEVTRRGSGDGEVKGALVSEARFRQPTCPRRAVSLAQQWYVVFPERSCDFVLDPDSDQRVEEFEGVEGTSVDEVGLQM